ncbi:hypothetical protein C8034_v011442 [Colletotrichum sidae]|uniref:Nucleoside phosphorylase domain-containing protein n=1 Tax=Colletotrichum sidae TaxID=1347389 RepID=A0A4R8TJ91_9PEZI|nr:hypothetical protein C8034_v011442 [Colletotrichum sidae]
MAMDRPTRREDFGVALICALPLEFDAAVLTLDEIWEDDEHHYGKAPGDHNHYTFGRTGRHNVVLLLLPNMGKSSSASACASLRHSFSALRLSFLCGICGGVPNPSPDAHIRLGDIIVAEAIVQYDFGRQYPSEFALKDTIDDSLGRASREIRSFLVGFKTDHGRRNLERRTATELDVLQAKAVEDGSWTKFTRPSSSDDVLFRADYPHRHAQSICCSDEAACKQAIETSCEQLGCVVDSRQSRVSCEEQPSTPSRSRVFIGKVGSGDTVMKSGKHRDRIAREHDLIGFEMEGAGIWDEMPCLVVKAVCDYADSHKNKKWQAFAAAAAASATKALLGRYNPGSSSVSPLQAAPAFEPPPSGPFFSVPHRQNSDFVDRPDVLGRVRNLFGHESEELKRARVAIHGLGGVGKTQIALAYCHWFRKRFSEASVFWVYAASVGRFRQAYNDIAQLCNIPGRDDPTVDVLPLVKEWLEKNHRGKWLLVIDNADDTEVFFHPRTAGTNFGIQDEAEPGGDVGRYVPECAQGSVLITSRNKQAAVRLTHGKQPIEVNKMTDDEAGELLRSILEDDTVSDEDVSLLSSKLEHLPLALAQAASYILRESVSIEGYVSLLDQSDFSVVDRLSEPFETVGRDSETPHALTATWMISFNQIERQHPLAGKVLSFISLLDRQSIPNEFL